MELNDHKWELPLSPDLPEEVKKVARVSKAYGQIEIISRLSNMLKPRITVAKLLAQAMEGSQMETVFAQRMLIKQHQSMIKEIVDLLNKEYIDAEEVYRRLLNV